MKVCFNCLWLDDCRRENHIGSGNKACVHYTPVDFDSVLAKEYEVALKERVMEYQEIIDSMED